MARVMAPWSDTHAAETWRAIIEDTVDLESAIQDMDTIRIVGRLNIPEASFRPQIENEPP
jgi:hypothetical protein